MDWQQVRVLFDEALAQTATERAAWLAQTCGGNEELRAAVERLLRAHGEADDFIETPILAQLADAPTLDLTGQRVGAYQVVRELGRGGMGVVYLAARADGEFRKQVAIKLLPAGADDQERQRFRRERQILADLEHPNIARLLDGGTLDEQPYVVMEFVPGQSLRARLRQQGVLSLDETQAIVTQVCAGLAEAHAHGIVHRDIKPENLIISEDHGQLQVKILDFGIAKLQQQTTTAQTQTATILGTVRYLSPEQAVGAGQADIDARADVYSLGMVIYEMLTGAPAFTSDSYLAVLAQHVHSKPAAPHQVRPELQIPPAVSAVVLRALAKDPAARQQSAQALAADFAQACLRGQLAEQPRLTRRLVSGLLIAALVVLGLWGARWWLKRDTTKSVLPTTEQAVATASVATATSLKSGHLQYRILKRNRSGVESVLQPNEPVRAGDKIRIAVTLPFSGDCYLFFVEGDKALIWTNPRPGQPPQQAQADVELLVPENVWIPYENDEPGKQTFIAVYVPDWLSWSLVDIVPAAILKKGLKVDPWEEVNMPYTRIQGRYAAELRQFLQEQSFVARFADPPIKGHYQAALSLADAPRIVSHEISFWHAE